MKIFLFLLSFNLILINQLYCQDIRSGEIYFSSLGYDSVRAEIVLYTQINMATNRDTVIISWGDGAQDIVPIGNASIIFPNVYKFVSIAYHQYGIQGLYQLNVEVSFYVNNISNIQNSSNEKINLNAELLIDSLNGVVDSPLPTLEQDFQWNCCNWIHNSSMYDPNNDSLSYSIVNLPVGNYTLPNVTIDSTGTLSFEPDSNGRYAFAFKVKKWRHINNGYTYCGYMVRQMLIDVTTWNWIDDHELNFELNIFPNPCPELLTIAFPLSEQCSELTITDVIGKRQLEEKLAANTKKKELNVSKLSPGIYFLTLVTAKYKLTKKLMVE